MMLRNKQWIPFIVYGLLISFIMLPLLKPGFLFLLDMTWTPVIDWGEVASNRHNPIVIWITVFKGLGSIVSLMVVQKIILILLLLGISLSMHFFSRRFLPQKWAFVSGILYLLNPYVYERFLGGQWLVLAGYAWFPFLLMLVYSYYTDPSLKRAIILSISLACYPLINPHWAYIFFMLFLFCLGGYSFITKRFPIKLNSTHILIGISTFLIINLFWLSSLFSGEDAMRSFELQDFTAFSTIGDSVGEVLLNILSLYGFWLQDYTLPKDTFPFWWIGTVLLLILSSFGLYELSRTKKAFAITITVTFLLVLAISVGYGSRFTSFFINALYHIPGFSGLRDTAKIIGVLAFFYAFFTAYGGWQLSHKLKELPKQFHIVIYICFLLIPMVTTHTMFWGFNGQITPNDYPESWRYVNTLLSQSPDTKALFLPWRGYMRFSFSNNHLIANPAERYFNIEVIQSHSSGNPQLRGGEETEMDQTIMKLLYYDLTKFPIITDLSRNEIDYFILAKVEDWNVYAYQISNISEASLVYDSPEIQVYKITRSTNP